MTKEELVQFLKDNLIISIAEDFDFSYSENQRKKIRVELRLGVDEYHSEIISSDFISIEIS
jgi:hypothetical protein